ncbi:hypothetical protein [Nocardioides cynanchi]|uniref:hypothetical protein n=1 Tax=Nocardioides cynanchi TaxID=2558918 RepID=UPI001246D249|nr:hypothetical protein [Nocardioides cynanchi]
MNFIPSVLVGTWSIEGEHPLLPGEPITGTAEVTWLDEQQLLLLKAHYDHPQIPDALSVTAVLDGSPTMHYFDPRGEHRVFSVQLDETGWRWWNDDPVFAQRWVSSFSEGGAELTGHVERSEAGGDWLPDIELTYRRR